MARVKKIWSAKPCKCGREPHVCQWTDTKKPNATWIECECGLMTKSFYSKDAELAKTKAIKMWNAKARRKKIKKGLRSCEKCGSSDIKILTAKWVTYTSYQIFCEGCGLCTDEIREDGHVFTEKEAKELWNV